MLSKIDSRKERNQ